MRPRLLSLLLLAAAAPARADAAPGDDFFTAKVRPILAGHCFKCHGPDDKARKAKLRLDVREEALKPARSRKRAIVPGKPDASQLVTRVFSAHETEVMPPPATKSKLTDAEKQTLKRWITDGAAYTPHWAFVAPKRPALPRVKQADWATNGIDYFVLARLEKEGLSPSPPADRYALLRRAYLDLVGVPPTPAEADAFVGDARPGAYERVIDRLLASPRYGERWGRRWLDLARYADTNGYEKDRARSIWPYRDWVIAAINAGMPFDRFTVEQLAGDMLPSATQSQRIATGFHRNTMLNEEGGIDPLEFRYHALTDRVATTGTVWLGLTVGCAQCHTHKFDPISHTEYHQFFAFLNNADEPEMPVRDHGVTARRAAVRAEVERLEARLLDDYPVPKGEARGAYVRKQFVEWSREEAGKTGRWQLLRPAKARASLPLLTIEKDGGVVASGDQSKSDTYEVSFGAIPKGVTAIRLEVLPDDRLPRRGPGRIFYEGPFGDFFLSEFTLSADGKKVALSGATHSFASGGDTAAKALDGDQQTGWSVNGGQGRAHTAVFALAQPLGEGKELTLKMLFERYYAAGLGRFRVWVTTDAKPAAARDVPTDLEPLLLLAPHKRSYADHQRLLSRFLMTAPALAKPRAAIDKLRREMPAHPTTLVMAERPSNNPRPTPMYHRGEFTQPGETVSAAAPAVLHAWPAKAPRDRLHFARWLVSGDNPLVGRVTVNREWSAFFGRGIVPTVQDFGLQGELPSHPELLDWLATELVREGWSLKRLHRLIVTSATYRQGSRVSASLLARDPANRLLARGPRVRLEAEMVRDGVLRASGLLAEKLGGPSVFPPQPAGVTTEGAYGQLAWAVSPGADRYRRGLYTFTKRTAPFALFNTFDGPSGEVCVAKREVSNTALQALTMLNDGTILEGAQALGREMAAAKGGVAERVEALFRRVLTRPPTKGEVALLVKFYHAQKGRLAKKELDAAALAGAGEGDVNERAAWAVLARALFNLDEAITKG